MLGLLQFISVFVIYYIDWQTSSSIYYCIFLEGNSQSMLALAFELKCNGFRINRKRTKLVEKIIHGDFFSVGGDYCKKALTHHCWWAEQSARMKRTLSICFPSGKREWEEVEMRRKGAKFAPAGSSIASVFPAFKLLIDQSFFSCYCWGSIDLPCFKKPAACDPKRIFGIWAHNLMLKSKHIFLAKE